MADDIEDIGGGDSAPSSEPASDPAEELSSEIRRSIDSQRDRGPDGKFVRSEAGKREAGWSSDAPVSSRAKGVATGVSDPNATPDRTGAANRAAKSGDSGQRGGTGEAAQSLLPPPGYSVAAKQAWDTLPEPVKADIVKREQEVSAGFQRYGGLQRFAERAEQNGTSLLNAVNDYDQVETALRKDPIEGVEFMFRKMGRNPIEVLKAWLSKYVPRQGQQASQGAYGQPQQYQQPIDPNAIASHAANMVRMEFQRGQIDNDIAAFAANPANRFFPNVRRDMAVLVQAGKAADLQTAYEAACWMHPEIRAIMLQDAAGGQNKVAMRTAQRAQSAAKAVTGAPSNSHAGEPPKRRDLSLDEEIRASIAAQKGLT